MQSCVCRRREKHTDEDWTRKAEDAEVRSKQEEEDPGREQREDADKQEEEVTREQVVSITKEQEENDTGEQERDVAREQGKNAARELEENRLGGEWKNKAVEEGAEVDHRRTSPKEEHRGSKSQDPEPRHVPGGTWLSQVQFRRGPSQRTFNASLHQGLADARRLRVFPPPPPNIPGTLSAKQTKSAGLPSAGAPRVDF
ncbi:hypothetical protein NDU88_007137 [Pleurodeles waltl]|uniref:Uncharacterized protein n=1 Tax=Pleurodeles waltl TaxID=8319 RepID=A0AAV7RU17_PLEWA|nr:hypothetical protein NDU88_007137 [Pleurodeles waltl]